MFTFCSINKSQCCYYKYLSFCRLILVFGIYKLNVCAYESQRFNGTEFKLTTFPIVSPYDSPRLLSP